LTALASDALAAIAALALDPALETPETLSEKNTPISLSLAGVRV
jgi:hypothetical protein